MTNNQAKYWASSKVTGPLLACPDKLKRVSPNEMARGGARPNTGRKVKPEDKRIQMSFMVHPKTKDRLVLKSKEMGTSLGIALDSIVQDLPTIDTNKKRGGS